MKHSFEQLSNKYIINLINLTLDVLKFDLFVQKGDIRQIEPFCTN